MKFLFRALAFLEENEEGKRFSLVPQTKMAMHNITIDRGIYVEIALEAGVLDDLIPPHGHLNEWKKNARSAAGGPPRFQLLFGAKSKGKGCVFSNFAKTNGVSLSVGYDKKKENDAGPVNTADGSSSSSRKRKRVPSPLTDGSLLASSITNDPSVPPSDHSSNNNSI